jgi:hypothetical protein
MKTILMVMIIILMCSCAKVRVKKEGEAWDVSYSVFLRELEDLDATAGSVGVKLGRTGSESPISSELIACLIAPELCK